VAQRRSPRQAKPEPEEARAQAGQGRFMNRAAPIMPTRRDHETRCGGRPSVRTAGRWACRSNEEASTIDLRKCPPQVRGSVEKRRCTAAHAWFGGLIRIPARPVWRYRSRVDDRVYSLPTGCITDWDSRSQDPGVLVRWLGVPLTRVDQPPKSALAVIEPGSGPNQRPATPGSCGPESNP